MSWNEVNVATPACLRSTDSTYREVSQTATTAASGIELAMAKCESPILPAPTIPIRMVMLRRLPLLPDSE
jgi:hypothetical protein